MTVLKIASRKKRTAAKPISALTLTCLALLTCASVAFAGPVWRLDAVANTTVAASGTLDYAVQATNVGDEATSGEEIVLTATLPRGMTAEEASLTDKESVETFACTAGDGSSPVKGAATVRCADTSIVPGFGRSLEVRNYQRLDLKVAIASDAEGTLTSAFKVSGGGAGSETSTVDPVEVASSPPGFGLAAFDALLADGLGDQLTQAGGHPDSAAFSFEFNTADDPKDGNLWPVAPVKDLTLELPAGLIGDPTAADTCTASDLANAAGIESIPLCPSSSQVGTTMVRMNTNGSGRKPALNRTIFLGPLPVYNMVPSPGVVAQFGFDVVGSVVTIDARVRTGGDYGVSVEAKDIPQGISMIGTSMTLWGVPASPAHDKERSCPGMDIPLSGGPTCPSGQPLQAFLRNPTSCTKVGSGLEFTARVDSWFDPGNFKPAKWSSHLAPGYPAAPSEWGAPVGITGCEKVPFDPTVKAQPQPGNASSPAGLSFDLSLPQPDEPESIGEGDVKKSVVTLPEGVRISPSAANGLEGCSPAEIGLHDANPASCPNASKVGAVQIDTPLLSKPLTGSIYLASPHDNPFGALVALYIVAEGSGVLLKLPGRVDANPTTGRLTTTFDDTPQTPFSNLHLEFFGGPGAPLVMPDSCGTYRTRAELISWSTAEVTTEPPFTVDHGAGGGACGPLGFSPSFTAGTSSNQAGAFSPFTLSFSRKDSEQQVKSLSFTMPPGVSAKLAGVPLCPDASAAVGNCPTNSQIGSVTVASGAGSQPYFLKGSVYLTGPYNGGPFGDVVVVPAIAGPFDLGNVVVRGSIRIDPATAQPTVVSDPFPQFVGSTGIPTDIRRVDVSLNRPGFTFNPTNCSQLSVTGALTDAQGKSASVSNRFQAAECRDLSFKPSFKVSTSGNTTRRSGASLHVRLTYPSAPQGTHANLARVKVTLPKQLPSNLPALQKACPAAQFAANPAGCPAESVVGHAIVHTPLLLVPLEGPAYFVSHGGEAFPNLIVVLQGDGVRIDVVADTLIKHGVTSSTFPAIPDVPFESFELTLPQGKYSALDTNGNLCAVTKTVVVSRHVKVRTKGGAVRLVARKVRTKVPAPLLMPTAFVAQNGATIQQNTPIRVTGCARHNATKKASRRHKRK